MDFSLGRVALAAVAVAAYKAQLAAAAPVAAAAADVLSNMSSVQLAATAAVVTLLALAAAHVFMGRPLPGVPSKRAYLLDFFCYRPPARLRTSRKFVTDAMAAKKLFSPENVEFQKAIMDRSGLGDETGLSDGIMAMKDGATRTTLADAIQETEMIMFDIVEQLLDKTKIKAEEIDVVLTSCSCFAPTPSMAAMIVNKFKMRKDCLTYSMAGMGCSSSLVCVDLAKHLLKALPNRRILVVNHENITNNWYVGEDRSMLVVNCLFRLGGACAIMSNHKDDIPKAKYVLTDTERTHLGREDDAYRCMGNGEDAQGIMGVFLRKNVVEVAGRSLKENVTRLAPRVLPWSELIKCARDKSYVPDFKKAFEHFLLHTGGRGVIDELEKALGLTPELAAPSKDTLFRFGNTSAASTWYILANIEHMKGVKKGDRVWQLGFGGGFKCNSACWKALKTQRSIHPCWEAY